MKQILTVLILAGFALNVSAETIVCETQKGNVLTLKYDRAKLELDSLTSYQKATENKPMGPVTNLTGNVGRLGLSGGELYFVIEKFPEPTSKMQVKMEYRRENFSISKKGMSFGEPVDFKICKTTKDELDQPAPAAGGDDY